MIRKSRSNRRGGRFGLIAALSGLALLSTPSWTQPALAASGGDAPLSHSTIAKQYGSLSMHFEPYKDGFVGRASTYRVFLDEAGAAISLSSASVDDSVLLRLVSDDKPTQPQAEGDRGGRSHYIHGRDETNWRTDVPHYDRVIYRSVYKGVDWIFYGNGRRLEYDFVVDPGGDPSEIAFRLDGVQTVREAGRKIVAELDGQSLVLEAPLAFQRIDGETVSVEVAYELAEGGEISFQIGEYDRRHTLVIDPLIEYATYLGGAGADIVADIAVDSDGQAIVVGSTRSPNFPTTADATQEALAGGGCAGALIAARCFDAFVAKLSADGSRLVHATYIGGTGNDHATSVAVNDDSIVVSGTTWADDFPVSAGAFQSASAAPNDADAFVLKLGANGALRYATYLGGSDADEGIGVAVDSAGEAYVTGHTASEDFPTANSLQPENRSDRVSGELDVFVTKLSADGSRAVYSTYLGGSRSERAGGIAVDGRSNAYVTGSTGSPDFPTSDEPRAAARVPDAFLTKISVDGAEMVYSTRLGGSEDEAGSAISLNDAGVATIVGSTTSTDFPTTLGVIVPTIARPAGFAAQRNVAGDAWAFATYLVGTADNLAVAESGEFYVSGTISSSSPIFGGAEVPACNGSVLRKINATATRLLFSGFQEGLGSVALDRLGALYTASTQPGGGLQTTLGAFQSEPQG